MRLKNICGSAFALLGLACSGVVISWSLFVWWDAALKLWKVGAGTPVTFFGPSMLVAILGAAVSAVVIAVWERFWTRRESKVRQHTWITTFSVVAAVSVLVGLGCGVFAILHPVGKS